MKNILFAALALSLLLFGCASRPGGIPFNSTNNTGGNAIACTAEAKLCPDGSAVGRTGPNCEFAPCKTSCSNYSADLCPRGCEVCPPCEVCSSISCQAPEFCERMGFNSSWYDSVKPPLPEINTTPCTDHMWRECGDFDGCTVCGSCAMCDAPSCQTDSFCEKIAQERR